MILKIAILTLFLWGDTSADPRSSELREKYDSYGEDWMFIPDGNGKPQVAVLKEINDIREVLNSPILYILYTRSNPDKGIPFYSNDTKGLKSSKFSAARKTKFITHGWKSSASSASVADVKSAYLNYGDYNIFLVDWEPLAASTFYLGPMRNTGRVGQDAAKFIDALVRETGIQTRDIHFIGHSLGAHVAGNAGAFSKSGRLGRVTGLDPALPGVHMLTTEDNRLDPNDATFVDVVHSCGGILGFLQPLGHVDFYPNAGTAVQPGCCCVTEITEACSHGRSYMYFTESIVSKTGFVANKCDSWNNYVNGNCDTSQTCFMGEHIDPTTRGSYFLRTRSSAPYAYMEEEITNNQV